MDVRVDLLEEKKSLTVETLLTNFGSGDEPVVLRMSLDETSKLAEILNSALAGAGRKIKENFHSKNKEILLTIAKELGLKKSEYDVRSNKSGPAIGEVILHTDKFYLMVSGYSQDQFMYRSVTSRKDYTGGDNQWLPASMLEESSRQKLLTILRRFQ